MSENHTWYSKTHFVHSGKGKNKMAGFLHKRTIENQQRNLRSRIHAGMTGNRSDAIGAEY